MIVIPQQAPAATPLAGIRHITWAGSDEGLSQLSIWRQSMGPGGATPPHRHDCDEVVLCLAGNGEVWVDGVPHPFSAGSTIVLPRDLDHQLINTGDGFLETIGILAASPVMTRLPDGQPIALPWRT